MTVAQEQILVQMLKYCGHCGVPMTKAMICQYAEAICGHTLSKNWPDCFARCHPDLASKLTTGLQSVHAGALNRTNTSGTYDLKEFLTNEYNILPENVYNADEKGAIMGDDGQVKVLVGWNQKTVHRVQDGNWESVTVMECISAVGVSLRLTVIFKGQQLMGYWFKPGANPANAS